MTVFPYGGAAEIWRDGVAYNPKKEEIRPWAGLVERYLQTAALLSAFTAGASTVAEYTAAATAWANQGVDHLICDQAISVNGTIEADSVYKKLTFINGGKITQTVANTPTFRSDGGGTGKLVVEDMNFVGYGMSDSAATVNNAIHGATAMAIGFMPENYDTVVLNRPWVEDHKNAGFSPNFCKTIVLIDPRGRGTHHTTGEVQQIEGITQADPAVVTLTGHGYSTGTEIHMWGVSGMPQANGKIFKVTALTANTFSLQDQNGVDVDATGWDAYVDKGLCVSGVFDPDIPVGSTARQQFVYRISAVRSDGDENWRSEAADRYAPESDISAAHGGARVLVYGGMVADSCIGLYVAPGWDALEIYGFEMDWRSCMSQHVVYAQLGNKKSHIIGVNGEPDSVVVKAAFPATSRREPPRNVVIDFHSGRAKGGTGSPIVSYEGNDKQAALTHPWAASNGPSRMPCQAPRSHHIFGRDGQDWLVSARNCVNFDIAHLAGEGIAPSGRARFESAYSSGRLSNCPNLGNTEGVVATFGLSVGADLELVNCVSDRGNITNNAAQISISAPGGRPPHTITAITAAQPPVVTLSSDHGLIEDAEVWIEGVAGMTEVNGATYRIVPVPANADKFTLRDRNGDDVDGTGWTAYSSGGSAYNINQAYPITPYAWWYVGGIGQVDTKLFRCVRTGMTDPGSITLYAMSGVQTCGEAEFEFIGDVRNLWADCGYLFYDAKSAPFSVGKVVTNGTAKALILGVVDNGSDGYLVIGEVFGGTFGDNDALTASSGGGAATADIPGGVMPGHLGSVKLDDVRISNAGATVAPIFLADRRLAITMRNVRTPANKVNTIKGVLRQRISSDIPNAGSDIASGDNGLRILDGISIGDRGFLTYWNPASASADVPPALSVPSHPRGRVWQNWQPASGGNIGWAQVSTGVASTSNTKAFGTIA